METCQKWSLAIYIISSFIKAIKFVLLTPLCNLDATYEQDSTKFQLNNNT
jgi:hypothetical protein